MRQFACLSVSVFVFVSVLLACVAVRCVFVHVFVCPFVCMRVYVYVCVSNFLLKLQLNEVEMGGSTVFPKLNIGVKPVKVGEITNINFRIQKTLNT